MPLSPTTYLLLIRPTPGDDDDVWDDLLNAALGLVDAHDHTTNKGAQVPSAGININAALTFAGNRATNVGGVALSGVALLSSGTREIFSETASGNLYYRNTAGTNVRITNANALDVTTVGGIAGDYTSVGAEVAFVDASDWYTFKQQTGAGVRQYAKMQSSAISLFEYKAHPAAGVPTNAVTLQSPAALGAGYVNTYPAALPGSQVLQQITAAGQLVYSNTVPNLVTLSAGATAAAGQSFTVSGAGRYKHGDYVKTLPGNAMNFAANWTVAATAASSTALGSGYMNFPFDTGEQVTSFTFARLGNGVADMDVNVYVVRADGTSGLIGTVTLTNPAAAWTDTTINITDTTLAAGEAITCEFLPNAVGISVGTCRMTYNQP